MEQIRQYEIIYTEAAAQDIEEKADYIAAQFCDPDLAENWYFRLKADLQKQLSTFPLKYPLYDVEPWNQRGSRLLRHLGMPHIRFHDTRHPYVKYKAKNFLNFFAVPEPIVNCNYNPMLVC